MVTEAPEAFYDLWRAFTLDLDHRAAGVGVLATPLDRSDL
jgi:hypothetical protein